MLVVFHMNTRSTQDKRRWDKFHLLADYFVERGDRIFLTGTKDDEEYNESVMRKIKNINHVIDLSGLTNLKQLKDLLNRCDLLVTVNTFVMHLGVALGTPMVAIVGATNPKIILPNNISYIYSEYAKDISLESVIEKVKEFEIA